LNGKFVKLLNLQFGGLWEVYPITKYEGKNNERIELKMCNKFQEGEE
jgi:hypothetical protein